MKQTINLGTAANDKTGTKLRAAGKMINDNFDELYAMNGNNVKIRVVEGDNIAGLDASMVTALLGLTPTQAGIGYVVMLVSPLEVKAVQVFSDGTNWWFSSLSDL